MSTPRTFVVKCSCNASVRSGGRGTTADGDDPIVLRLARIRTAIVTVVLPFPHLVVGDTY